MDTSRAFIMRKSIATIRQALVMDFIEPVLAPAVAEVERSLAALLSSVNAQAGNRVRCSHCGNPEMVKTVEPAPTGRVLTFACPDTACGHAYEVGVTVGPR